MSSLELPFFLVRRGKRARHENDHAHDWRRVAGEARPHIEKEWNFEIHKYDLIVALKRLKFPAYSAGHCRLGNNVAGQIVPFAHNSNKERVPAVFMHIY